MTRELALAVMIGAAVLLLAAGVWGWRRRTRRDSTLSAPYGEAPGDAEQIAVFPGLYVATTRHGEPLERLAIAGLGFRSRVTVTVTDAGVALDLTGQPRIFLATDRIDAVDRATVAIDRVVEKDGLVRLTWRTDTGPLVDTYLRGQESSSRTLAGTISGILPTTPTPTGTDA